MLFNLLFRKNIKNASDEELTKLLFEGDKAAHGELFRRYAHLVMGVCLKYLQHEANSEDLMMKIFEGLPNKNIKTEIKHFKSWIYTCSKNECLMLLRKKKQDTASIDVALLYTEDNAEAKLERALQKELEYTKLEKAIARLKPDQRNSIELFYLKNMSYDIIAKETKQSLKQIKSHIQNGKRKLKIILESDREFEQ